MPSQHLGLLNSFDNGNLSNHLIAVELDTVKTIEFNDVDDNHVGIDVNNLISSNSTPAGYYNKTGSFVDLKLISGDLMQVWINYYGGEMRLEVRIAPVKMPKPAFPIVSSIVNFSDVVLDEMYVGFSASTGAGSGLHCVLGWSFSLNGNAPSLNLSSLPSIPQKNSQNPNGKSSVVPIVTLSLIGVILVLIAIPSYLFYLRRRKKFAEIKEEWELEYGPHRIPYRDLYNATKGFNESNLIGSGGFGRVYKGTLSRTKTEVAVKRISYYSKQGLREFVSEIVSLSRLRHRNLVQLLGYCRRQEELLLVYDFMENGSLERFLFKKNKPSLGWNERFKVIKDVATGLLYLHEGWDQVVIHRDIKASNVLLDSNHNAKLSDFGLAKLYDHGENPQTTHIVGTLGYIAPEISRTGKPTTCSDVFAFGIFLLEVTCARRPMDFTTEDVPGLIESVLDCWKKSSIIKVVDPKLEGSFDEKEAALVLKLGLLCSHPEPTTRPSIRQVVQILVGNEQMPDLSSLIFGGVTSYDQAFDEIVGSYDDELMSQDELVSDETSLKHSYS
ncbi:hypothetical protein LUZ60_011269 [Juncus effusus]|nr:hypothetical protein LUZ60_011269 [Juncus effusus]